MDTIIDKLKSQIHSVKRINMMYETRQTHIHWNALKAIFKHHHQME